jgi:hypothetical protein
LRVCPQIPITKLPKDGWTTQQSYERSMGAIMLGCADELETVLSSLQPDAGEEERMRAAFRAGYHWAQEMFEKLAQPDAGEVSPPPWSPIERFLLDQQTATGDVRYQDAAVGLYQQRTGWGAPEWPVRVPCWCSTRGEAHGEASPPQSVPDLKRIAAMLLAEAHRLERQAHNIHIVRSVFLTIRGLAQGLQRFGEASPVVPSGWQELALELCDAAFDYHIHSELWSGISTDKTIRLLNARHAMQAVLPAPPSSGATTIDKD